MGKVQRECLVCGRKFADYDAAPRFFCSVGCEYDAGSIPAEAPRRPHRSRPARTKRIYTCKKCGEIGHNKATCGKPVQVEPEAPKPRGRKPKTVEQFQAEMEERYPGITDLLGEETDASVGEKYGITRQRVHQFRKKLDVASTRQFIELTPEQIERLGTVNDRILASEWGIAPYLVGQTRRNLGIKAWSPWIEHEKALAPYLDQIGKISDPKVAAMAGVNTRVVFEYRKRHNIKTEVLAPTHEDFSPIDREEIERLFNEEYSDNEIAEMMGCSAGTIGFIRSNELGLLRYKPSRPTTPGERERIKRVYENCGQNISETARRTDRSMSCVRKIVGR